MGDEDGGIGWPRAGALAAIAAGAIAMLAVAGWATGAQHLAALVPGLPTMKANTAVAVALCALALRIEARVQRHPGSTRLSLVVMALGAIAAAIGLLTLLEYLVGNLGTDQLFVHDASPGPASGRAAPHTAAVLIAIGAALAARERPRVRAAAIAAGMLAALVGAIGYAYRVDPLTGAHGAPGMAPNTLAALVLLLLGLVAARPGAWPLAHLRGARPAATMARRLVAAIAVVPVGGLTELQLQRAGLWSTGVGLVLLVVTTVGLLAGVVAITVRALDRLDRADRRFHGLLEAAPDAMVVADRDGRIVVVNNETLRMSGYDRAELVAQDVRVLLPERLQVAEPWESVGDRSQRFVRRRDGLEIPVEISLNPIETDDGELVIAAIRDVTERVEAEHVLREANVHAAAARDEALATSRMKSSFLANMSHEIRTPLNGVLGIADLLLDGDLSPQQREHAELIKRSGDTLLTVVNDILDVSKIEAGALQIETAPFDLVDAVEDVFDLTAEQAAEKGLELTMSLDPGLPASVVGDAVRLRQILGNLLSNSIKFTPKGEIRVSVSCAGEDGSRVRVRFEVADEGLGIAPGDLRRMFEPFTQADPSTTRRFGGTGLGLAIVAQLVRMMGGEAGATSTPGEGSTFWATIPFEPGPVPLAGPRLGSLSGCLLLVVDDNEANQRLMAATARSWGMRVTAVADGEQALAALRDAARCGDPYECAAVDLRVPGMDGFALADAIRADAEIPTPALLALTRSSGERRASRVAGIDVCMPKPVRRTRLRAALLEATGARRREGAERPAPAGHARGARVLVVEDNAINRTVAVELAQRRGCEVTTADDGLEALAALQRESFDLVLMDCQMPELDGYDATRQLRAMDSPSAATPVVAMTAHALPDDRRRCLDSGMDDYVAKPIRAEDVDRVLARFVPWSPKAERLVDAQCAADLRARLGGSRALGDLMDLFSRQAGELLVRLREAVDAGEAPAVAAAAHKLRGSCLALAATPLAELCGRLDQQARTGELDGAAALIDEIAAVCGPTETALRDAFASDS